VTCERKLARIEHLLTSNRKFVSKEEKLRRFSRQTCKIHFESHFLQLLSKENFLVCHYLIQLGPVQSDSEVGDNVHKTFNRHIILSNFT